MKGVAWKWPLPLENVPLDSVLFAPANVSYHKLGPRASYDERATMVELLIKNYPHFALTTIDRDLGGPTYTFRTLDALKGGPCRTDELFFIMGADSMEQFHTWKRWRHILGLARPVVLARPGHCLRAPGLSTRSLERFIIVRGFQSTCSSTKARAQIAERGFSPAVPRPVMEFIRERSLYARER